MLRIMHSCFLDVFLAISRDDVVLLPSSTTKTAVWTLYQAAAGNTPDVKPVGYSSFWKQLPHILVCKMMSDLCWRLTTDLRRRNQKYVSV